MRYIWILCLLLTVGQSSFSHSPIPSLAEAPKDTTTQKKPRYSVRKTSANTEDEVKAKAIDLRDPDNLQTEVSYDEKTNTYQVGTTLKGGTAKDTKRTTSQTASKPAGKSSNKTSTNQSRNATNVTSTGTASGLG